MTEDEYIHVIIDAEVLKRDATRTRGAFRALAHLATTANVRIHIPEIARQEFLTAQEQTIDDEFRDAISALKKARTRVSRDDRAVLDAAVAKLTAANAEAKQRIQGAFASWCDANQVILDPVAPDHGRRVMKRYFQGSVPFRAAKHRDDIPDAFIYECLKDVAINGRDVIFITADKRLRRAAEGVAGTAYATIEEFLERENIAHYLRQGIVESQLTAAVDALMEVLVESGAVHQRLSSDLEGRRVWMYYPVDIVATISAVADLSVLWIDDKVAYYGNGLLGLPISARALCRLRAELPPGFDEAIASQPDVSITTGDAGSGTLQVDRTHVVTCTILVAVPEAALEKETKLQAIQRAVRECEWVLDDVRVQGDMESEGPAFDELMKHALDEAEKQLAAGDHDVMVDPAEEAILAARARWVDIPERFHGTHGKLTIGPNARLKLRPPGRFEMLVKSAKRTLLKMQNDGESGGG